MEQQRNEKREKEGNITDIATRAWIRTYKKKRKIFSSPILHAKKSVFILSEILNCTTWWNQIEMNLRGKENCAVMVFHSFFFLFFFLFGGINSWYYLQLKQDLQILICSLYTRWMLGDGWVYLRWKEILFHLKCVCLEVCSEIGKLWGLLTFQVFTKGVCRSTILGGE